MLTIEEVEKMTLQQIKTELKSRKLGIVGTKDKLKSALLEAVKEELLLGPSTESDVQLGDLDEAELLGEEPKKPEATVEQPKPEPKVAAPAPVEPKEAVVEQPKPVAAAPAKKPIEAPVTAQNDAKKATKPTTDDVEAMKKKRAERFGIGKRAVDPDVEAKKKKRAERFGIGKWAVDPEVEAKKKKRAERFGIQQQ